MKDVQQLSDSFLKRDFSSVQQMWEEIKAALQAIISQRVPSKLTSPRHTNPWITTEIRRAIRRKQRAHAKCRSSKKKKDIDRYRRLQKEVKYMIRVVNKQYVESSVDEAYTSNPKRFWRYVKSKGQDSSGVPPLKDKDGFLKSDNQAKSEILNDHLKSVFTQENLTNIPDKSSSPYTPMPNITVHVNGVVKLQHNLKTSKATGSGSIPAFILKTAAEEIAPTLTRLFQRSLDTGEVPTD